jgi:ABC transporter substrate binding protein
MGGFRAVHQGCCRPLEQVEARCPEVAVAGRNCDSQRSISPNTRSITPTSIGYSEYDRDRRGRSCGRLDRKRCSDRCRNHGDTATDIRVAADIENTIRAASGQSNLGLIVAPAPPISGFRKLVIELAMQHRFPAIYPFRYYVAEGGLMSYGAEPHPMWAQAATYVDRILRGEKPVDLPVQAPTRFQLVINVKTAKAMGLPISETLLLRADELIE